MNKIINWYTANYVQCTWFIIGWLAMAGISALVIGNYTAALVDFVLVGVNYMLLKR